MRNILLLLFVLSLLLSCKKPPLEYSCDPKVNEFVTENHEKFKKIGVRELVAYDPKVQRAIFNSWDYQKKRAAWVDKLQYVLNHNSLNDLEKNHIIELISHIHEDYFKKQSIEVNALGNADFSTKWISYSSNKLKWSRQFIAFLVYRMYTDQSQLEEELSELKTIKSSIYSNSEAGNCNCNSSVDFCGGFCNTGSCSITTGCGWLWSSSCNGNCY